MSTNIPKSIDMSRKSLLKIARMSQNIERNWSMLFSLIILASHGSDWSMNWSITTCEEEEDGGGGGVCVCAYEERETRDKEHQARERWTTYAHVCTSAHAVFVRNSETSSLLGHKSLGGRRGGVSTTT